MFEVSNTFLWMAVFAILAAFVNGLGILTVIRYRIGGEKVKPYFMCFAAGMLVSVPLMLAFPRAIQKNFYAGFMALIGFLFMFFSNEVIKHHTKEKELAFGVTAAEGIGIHSFIDGIVYTVSFQASILVGILTGMGMVVHEFAEGMITYLFLVEGGAKKKIAMVYGFAIAGLTTPIGAFIVYPLIASIKDVELGLMLGFTAGVLLYTASSHLLPEARAHEKKHSIIAFLAGVGMALFIVMAELL